MLLRVSYFNTNDNFILSGILIEKINFTNYQLRMKIDCRIYIERFLSELIEAKMFFTILVTIIIVLL